MRARSLRRLAAVLLFVISVLLPLSAQSNDSRARIALYEPAGQKEDAPLAAVLATVADSVEISLDVLQRYEVTRLPPADPAADLARVKAYCEANRIDEAILGSGSAHGSGYDFRLVVYDRRKDAITVDKQGSSSGALDMFDATDALVASLLDGLSGTHLLFGSLTVETDPAGAIVAVNGKDVGASPVSLRGLPVGTVQVSAHAGGREEAQAAVTIADGQSTDQSLSLARSTGTLSVKAPADAVIAIRSTEIGEKDLSGSASVSLPTGDYQVVATDAGLPAVPTNLTITRGQTLPWLPWTTGWLAIRADGLGAALAGAQVTVDGQDRGTAPQVMEVQPGVLHRVELKAAHYQPFVAELSAAAADKTVFQAELAPNPGSIKVVTSMPGVPVFLDDGQNGNTPVVFEHVAGGLHSLTFSSVQVDRRIFVTGASEQVQVQPDEQAVVSRTVVPGEASLAVTDAPEGSVVDADGKALDSALAFSDGAPLQAGLYEVSVRAPSAQTWTTSVRLDPGSHRKFSLNDMIWHLARRTISMKGISSDWKGLLPIWVPIFPTGFNGQAGTRIVRGLACRDDSMLYLRFEFSDGKPTTKLAKSISTNLIYVAEIQGTSGAQLQPRVHFQRSQEQLSELFAWFNAKNSGLTLSTNFKFVVGESSLEMAVPIGPMKPYLGDNFASMSLHVINEDSNFNWTGDLSTNSRLVAFDF